MVEESGSADGDPESGAGAGTPAPKRTRAARPPRTAGATGMSVVERLVAVLNDLPAIGKDSKAPDKMGGYAFRGIEAITAQLKPLMAKHGVICYPRILKRIEGERQLRGGGLQYVVDLHVEWTFIGVDGDKLVSTMWGEGTDMGDKATQKAVTSSFKSLLTPTFLIGDSATDSERHSTDESSGTRRRTRRTKDAPPDPDAWFPQNGWLDKDHHDQARKAITDSIASMPDEAKEQFKSWSEVIIQVETDQGMVAMPRVDWRKVWPEPLVIEMRDKLKELAAVDWSDTSGAETLAGQDCTWCHKPVPPDVAVVGHGPGVYHPACNDEETRELDESFAEHG